MLNQRIVPEYSTRAEKTSNNQTIVNKSASPRNFFKWSIHIPGLGSHLIVPGKKAITRKGNANPIAMNVNTITVTYDSAVKAYVKAAPKNGAEHGVDKGLLSKIISWFLSKEYHFFSNGRQILFGSSLVIVARKKH